MKSNFKDTAPMKLVSSAIFEEIEMLDQEQLRTEGFLVQPLGIGFLQAAINLEKLLANSQKVTEVFFLGTAGSYKKNLELNSIVSVDSSALLNLGELQKLSYIPSKQEIFDLKKVHNYSNALCLSSLEISATETISNLVADKFVANKFIVENMELYGIAQVCKKYEIPLTAFLGITNYINSNAHDDWLINNQDLSKKLCEELLKYINSSRTQLSC